MLVVHYSMTQGDYVTHLQSPVDRGVSDERRLFLLLYNIGIAREKRTLSWHHFAV